MDRSKILRSGALAALALVGALGINACRSQEEPGETPLPQGEQPQAPADG
jgi:hypothetical protein